MFNILLVIPDEPNFVIAFIMIRILRILYLFFETLLMRYDIRLYLLRILIPKEYLTKSMSTCQGIKFKDGYVHTFPNIM